MAAASAIGDPLPGVRVAVRGLLTASPAFARLPPESRRELAQAMVTVCHRAALLVREEVESGTGDQRPAAPPLAVAQSAGSEFSGVAADRVAGTTRAILNAVSFPRFVTELINGVFKAITDSNTQQMNQYVELLRNVAASTEGFDEANIGADGARGWLVEHFPGSFELVAGEEDGDGGDARRVQLREGASMPPANALKVALGLDESEQAPAGDPEGLVPLARRQLAKGRQQMLATMVMLGMQRIVIDSGRINAAMRFHIDTRSAAAEDKGSRFDLQNQINASGSYGTGVWGVSAAISNTIGYVSTQRTQTTEEMNTDLDLNSSVELLFRSDYLPLDRLAGSSQVARIRQNSLNPEAEERAAAQTRGERQTAQRADETARRTELDQALAPPRPPTAPRPGAPGTTEASEQARQRGSSNAGQPSATRSDTASSQPAAPAQAR